MPIQIADAHRQSLFAQRQTGLLFNLPPPDPTFEQLPEGISLCMIVKNEERFLRECLESVKDVVDEINIVDTGSTDRTVEIAREYGANVIFREWRNDFAWARNEAIQMATKRWTFVLDADEELEAESVSLVRSLRTAPAQIACVYINIVNIIDDATGVGTMSHRLIRIFPTNPVLRYSGYIHEAVVRADGEMVAVLAPITILHKGYTTEMLSVREKDVRNKPLLAKAFEENDDDAFAMFNFGNSAIVSGNAQQGIEILEKMLADAPTVKIYFPLAYLMLGQTYMESLGDSKTALDRLEEGIAKFPNDAGLIFTKGQVFAKLNRLEEARELFHQALSLRDVMAYSVMTDEEIFEWKLFYSLAGTYERERDYETAISFIEKALENKPNSFHLQRAKAAFLEGAGRNYDAEVAFRAMAASDPQRGQVELVNFLLRRRRFAQAIAIVENEIDPGANHDMVAALNLAAARAVIEAKYGDPMPFLEAARRLAPGSGNVISLLEQVLTERGRIDELATLHAEELEAPLLRPGDFVRRSFRLLALGRNDEARQIAEQGLLIEPRNAELRFNYANAMLRMGDEAGAAHEFSRVEAHAPNVFASAMQLHANLSLKLGDADEALNSLEQRLSVLPGDVDAVLDGARALAAAGAREQAKSLLEPRAGSDQRIALELAGLLLADGDFAGAGRIATAALT